MVSLGIDKRAQWIVAVAIVIGIGAVIRYPGGTALDATTHGYSLSRNFGSDLGMTIAWNHEPNRLGATCFTVSLLLLVVGLGNLLRIIARFLAMDEASRRWAQLAAVAGVAVCVAVAGAAVMPKNQPTSLHSSFMTWAWRIVPAMSLFLGLACQKRPRLRQRTAVAWFTTAIVLGAYAALRSWGPTAAEPDGLVVQVVAQKVAVVAFVSALLIAGGEVEQANRQASTNGRVSVLTPAG